MALTDGLVAYWKLDESSGNASDSSGNSKTLTNTNTVAYSAAKINNGADFGSANTNKYLTLGSNLPINFYNGSNTFSCWVKMNTQITSGFQCFMGGGDSTTKTMGYILYEYNGGNIRIRFRVGARGVNFYDILSSNYTISTSAYTHLAMTYDGSTLTGYINGVSAGTVTAGVVGTVAFVNAFALGTYIDDTGTSLFASAIVDETGVWNRCLNSTEIGLLYNNGNALPFPLDVTTKKFRPGSLGSML